MLTAILMVLCGAAGAAVLDRGFGGFAVGAAIGFLLGRQIALSDALHKLQRQLAKAEKAAAPQGAERSVAPVRPVAASAENPPAPVRPAQPAFVARPQSPPVATAAARSPSAVLPPLPAKPQHDPVTLLIERAVAWMRGGNPLARIGIVILFFGGAFLAKYAADSNMFPLELRLALLAAGGLVLLAIGWRLRTRRAMFAQILQGGGIAGMYLTVFAATRLYHLLPHSLALGLMIAVALASAVLAVAQNSLTLAVLGFAGGFLAPIMLSTGGGSHIALFTYYAVLNLGVFTVAWFRAWRVLNLVGFVFTFGITGLWRANAYLPENLASADFFLLLFFAMYVAISVLFALRQKPDLKGYVSASLVFGLPVVVTSLHASLVRDIEYAMAWSALGFGLFYLALAWILFRTARDNLRLLAEAFAALGVVFASLAVPLAFDQNATALLWAVEGAGLLWLGVRQDRKLARAFALLLQLAAGLRFLGQLHAQPDALLFLNGTYLGAASLALAGLFSAAWLQRNSAQRAAYETSWDTLAALWGVAWWIGGGLVEIDRHASHDIALGLSLTYVVLSAALLHRWGRRWPWSLPQDIALALLPLAAAVGLVLAHDGHPLMEGGWLGWPLLFAVHYRLLWLLGREPERAIWARRWLHAGAVWLLALVGAWELHWQLEQNVPGVWRDLPWGVVPALALLVLSARKLRPDWPLAQHAHTYRQWAAAPLAMVAALWVLAANLCRTGDPGWLPYLPLLNPLDLSSALILLALALWTLALARTPPRPAWFEPRACAAAIAGLAFVWLSAALVRELHYGFGTPIDLHGIAHSTPVQAALSVFWGLIGFVTMLVATRRALRWGWVAGAGLMGLVVLKLFLVDLSGSGTLARIVSFLSIGALLLVTGYLSPLPPRRPEPEPTA
ncbi:MAG TPA: DUF2339 domain-containing protein [Solimonas sp.]|nr:DUF2339 domain-containing protein [Solimonas sp.]